MRKILILMIIITSIVSTVAHSDAGFIELSADIDGNIVDGNYAVMQVDSGTVLPVIVYKVVNGQNINITDSPYLIIDTANPSRLSIENNNVLIKQLSPEELVNAQDYKIAVLMLTYIDEESSEFGSLTVSFRIK